MCFKHVCIVLGAVATLALASCSSPLELDVDRKAEFIDGSVHPTRVSFYYYYGSVGLEAVVSDTQLLHEIWIEKENGLSYVTIPRFIFALNDTLSATSEYPVFVETFSFSTNRQLVDGPFVNCINIDSWMAGSYLDNYNVIKKFRDYATSNTNQIRVSYYTYPDERVIKATVVIAALHPITLKLQEYRALLTLEY